MSLEIAAKHLASKGRGPDTLLVHMAPGEVAGLQALAKAHGGSLTVNPDTGLPEAGFLSKILPMAAGAALTYFSGGTINPMTAGLIMGGGTAVATGSLNKGLMAGLGAYGGAGLASGIAGLAPAAAEGSAAWLGESTAAAPVPSGIPAWDTAAGSGVPAAQAAASIPGAATQTALNHELAAYGVAPAPATPAVSPIQADQVVQTATPTPPPPAPTYGERLSAYGDKLGRGWNEVMKDPMAFLKDNKMYAGAAGLPFLMGDQQQVGPRPTDKNPYSYTFDRGQVLPTPQPSPLGYEQRYFSPRYMAGGGLADINPNSPMANIQQPGYATSAQSPMPQEMIGTSHDMAVDPYSGQEAFAAGGVSHLGDYSDGGRLLKGPGDGVSDSIPATIADKQPARLADGEFVVPARIVSELGNGSTDAGARKLYKMMDRVQKARGKTVGKNKVATDTRAERLLPA